MARRVVRRTFFVDECLGRNGLREALEAAGHDVVLHHLHFAEGTDDATWLAELRSRRDEWVILTKDKKIRKRLLEVQALIAAGLRVFALTSGDSKGEMQVDAFTRALPKMLRISQHAGPYIARVTLAGSVKIVERPKPGRRKKHRMQPK